MIRIKEYAEQVTQNTSAHHPLTDAQPVPEQWHPGKLSP